MKLSDSSIRRPVTTVMIAVALLVFGMVGISRMPVDTLPKITVPMVIVGTVYPGAGPQEVEASVTLPLEKQLGSTPSLKKVSSKSVENISIITLEFDWGANLDAASADIRDRLGMAEASLPDAVQTPFILKLNTSLMPVAQYTLTGDMDKAELRQLADDMSELLQRVPGVASVSVSGGAVRQVHIDVDGRELADAGVTNEALMATLQAQNLYPVGGISTPNGHYLLRLIGQYDDVEQLRNTVIGVKGMTPILLRSVARVEWGPEELTSAARLNGKDCVFIIIQRRPDANTIQVAQGVAKEMAKIENTLPSGAKVNLRQLGPDQEVRFQRGQQHPHRRHPRHHDSVPVPAPFPCHHVRRVLHPDIDILRRLLHVHPRLLDKRPLDGRSGHSRRHGRGQRHCRLRVHLPPPRGG
jgi:HAE1 family hydrophobic/amphiphilic exporter-1